MILKDLIRRPGERLLAVAVLVVGGLDLVLAATTNARIDAAGFLIAALPPTAFLLIGGVYRLSGRSEPIAAAVLATALLLAFTLVLATYNYLILPVTTPFLDPFLARVNALVGYSWPAYVEWASRWTATSALLALVYQTSLAQIAILVAGLGLTGRFAVLDRMMITLALSAMICVAFWGVFPSIAISASEHVAPEMAQLASLIIGPDEGHYLLDVVTAGPASLSPREMMGLIGFPSFHMVLALICAWFAWQLPFARLPFLALNAVMLPAILLHGSHDVLDIVGGAAVFAFALFSAHRLKSLLEEEPGGRIAPAARSPQF